MDVEWKVRFLGNDLEINSWGDLLYKPLDWLATFISEFLPTFSSLNLAIPPTAQDLWEAFNSAMFEEYKTEDNMAKYGLHLDSQNNFRIILNKDTNI